MSVMSHAFIEVGMVRTPTMSYKTLRMYQRNSRIAVTRHHFTFVHP